jgi:hypothetical protein
MMLPNLAFEYSLSWLIDGEVDSEIRDDCVWKLELGMSQALPRCNE